MDYDEILNELGQFSKWHWLQYSIILLFPVTGAFATLSFSFTGMILFLNSYWDFVAWLIKLSLCNLSYFYRTRAECVSLPDS